MYWLLILVLFHADPALPDAQVTVFQTEAQCKAAIVEVGTALQKAGFEGYASGGIRCEPVSNPITEKKA